MPIRFLVQQRTNAEVPGTGGALRVLLGDITRGQVHTTVMSPTVTGSLVEQSLRAGDVVRFELRGTPLQLELVELHNALIGQDTAVLVLEPAGVSEANELERIDALLASLEAHTTCVFIRNGQEYTAAEAAEHLRNKLLIHSAEVRSVDDFIRVCASKSSLSGMAYGIRLADGREITSAEFLRELEGSLDGAR